MDTREWPACTLLRPLVKTDQPGSGNPASGYSGTPLARKLGIKAGMHMLVDNAPDGFLAWLSPLPDGVVFEAVLSASTQVVHLFVDRRAALAARLAELRASIRADDAIRVSWPKKAAMLRTDITESAIREVALPPGFVGIKVCAVSEIWSGLKLVIRKELR